jgi:hypothetical protein
MCVDGLLTNRVLAPRCDILLVESEDFMLNVDLKVHYFFRNLYFSLNLVFNEQNGPRVDAVKKEEVEYSEAHDLLETAPVGREES